MGKLNKAQTIALLEDIVAEKGADTYADCIYRDEATPVCIAGQAIFKVGGVKALISTVETERVLATNWQKAARANEKAFGKYFSVAALKVLDAVQAVQDSDRSWGEALATVKEEVNA